MGVGFLMIVLLYFYSVTTMFVYSGEIFPTEARLRGVGFSSGLGRFVSVFTPMLIAWLLTEIGATAVFLFIFMMMTIIAIIIAVFGVETRSKSLEDINEE